jgi:hypothetical protein
MRFSIAWTAAMVSMNSLAKGELVVLNTPDEVEARMLEAEGERYAAREG